MGSSAVNEETGATVSSAEQKFIFLLWLYVEHYCKRWKSKGQMGNLEFSKKGCKIML